MNKENIIIASITLVSIIGVWFLDPIPQDLKYHLFKDHRTILSIANFWNVLSNLPFLLVGISGLYHIFRSHNIKLLPEIKTAYILFFAGVSLVAFGSGYYHLSPDNETLVWDRLPMTIAFMALFSIIISEFISSRIGKLLLWPLIVFGVVSIFYWQSTEANGVGDLRLYILVQFLPLMLIPLILFLYKSKFTCISGYWLLLLAYVLAKVLEYFDGAIYNTLIMFSGHSIKHVVAAYGIFILLKAYKNRRLIT